MNVVRFGIVGVGNMGLGHAAYFSQLKGASLAAVCDIDPARGAAAGQRYNVPVFRSQDELLAGDHVDAVLIATPHYDHEPMAIAALKAGKHVLTEKPLAVTIRQGRRMIREAEAHPELKFGIMFQMRTQPVYREIRELIAQGELGEITRVTWIITDWFRTWTYYASGGWRATWKGEGGGVLLNQCPHNLDLLQWLTGLMPRRITAVGTIGKRHPIEVEDEVAAVLEFDNGAVGHFMTTTGEAPGTNRLEIAGDRGRIVAEDGKLTVHRTTESVTAALTDSPDSFPTLKTWTIDVPLPRSASGHQVITQNFADSILRDEPLIARGEEGIRGLEIGNAMLMSALTRKPVELPLDAEAYEGFLQDMIKRHSGQKRLPTRSHAAPVAIGASGRPI